jgi:hypothetical protein
MSKIVVDHFYQAWKWGLRGTGGMETEEGLSYLQDLIDGEVAHVPGLLDEIKQVQLEKMDKRELRRHLDMWVTTYKGVRDQAKLIEGQDDTLYRWDFGKTEEHCATCSAMEGKVKTRREWLELATKKGIFPKSRDLECGGWQCDCHLSVVKQEKYINLKQLFPSRPLRDMFYIVKPNYPIDLLSQNRHQTIDKV